MDTKVGEAAGREGRVGQGSTAGGQLPPCRSTPAALWFYMPHHSVVVLLLFPIVELCYYTTNNWLLVV